MICSFAVYVYGMHASCQDWAMTKGNLHRALARYVRKRAAANDAARLWCCLHVVDPLKAELLISYRAGQDIPTWLS